MESLTGFMPGEVHPAYGDVDATAMLQAARRQHGAVYLAEADPLMASFSDYDKPISEVTIRTRILTLKLIAAPCPYVGTRQWYVWEALVDDLGRGFADAKVWRAVDQSRAFIEGWKGADDEWPA